MMMSGKFVWRAGAQASAFLACAIALTGCVSESTSPPRLPTPPPPRGTPNPVNVTSDGRILDAVENPAGYTFSLDIHAEQLALGSIPFDQFLLPLVSPDGRVIATQVGAAPDWPTVLAERQAIPPIESAIELYALDTRSNIAPEQRQPPALIATVNTPALLGRACDAEGFLVEAPQVNGSRWIGKASWQTGEVEWIVQDEFVNAFAALAPDGRLAWCRRAIDSEHFDLVVRDRLAHAWIVPGNGGDWLMPVWETLGDGLYAMHRQHGRLRLCYGQAAGHSIFTATLRDFLLIAQSDKYAAYQAFISQGSLDGMNIGDQPQVLVFHPGLGRMIIWKPLAPKDHAATLLNVGSLVALQQTTDSVVICARGELLLQSLRQPNANILLNKGTWIPRRTSDWAFPFILLSPVDARVYVIAVRLIPRSTAIK